MKKVILFGAGQIGYDMLTYYGEDVVHCFADNNPKKIGKTFFGKKIISFNEMLDIYNKDDYEIVISTLAVEALSKQLEKAGIIKYKDFKLPIIYDNIAEIKSCIPKELITSDCLDIVVRYLYAKDILCEIKNTPNRSLYARMVLTKNSGYEKTPEKTKESLDTFFNDFENVCKNIQEEGLKKDSPIIFQKDNKLRDGAHRLAVALVLDKDSVPVGVFGESRVLAEDINFEWFQKNGFSFGDKIRLLRGFSDLYEECGIFMLFAPIREHWDYIGGQIEKEFKTVGAVDIDLSHNFIAFEILIREMYGNYSEQSGIGDKVSFLKMSPLVTRVILVSNEKKKLPLEEFYKNIVSLKFRLRDILGYDEIQKDSFCLIHSSCNYNEFVHMKNVLLSVNNLKSIEGRISPVYRGEFLRQCEFVKDYCKENNIPAEKICVMRGSTTEVLGIRTSRDIDFIITSDLHPRILPDFPKTDLIPNGPVYITPSNINEQPYKVLQVKDGQSVVAILPDSKIHFPSKNKLIDTDIIINNDAYHIMFYGLKFVNLEFVVHYKKMRDYESDRRALRLIQLYYDYINNFDDKKVLKEQIEAELKVRKEREAKTRAIMAELEKLNEADK